MKKGFLNDFYNYIYEHRLTLAVAFAAGLAAFMFVFTNKLLTPDELICTFDKGSTVSSGRWGLELMKAVFPDYSMPWLYGVASLALLSLAACVTTDIFRIESKVLAALLAALFVTFPAQAITFGYMFTAAPYAAAVLMSVLSVRVFLRGGKLSWLISIALLSFSLGIYQAYLCFAAGYYIVWLIQCLLKGEADEKSIIISGLKAVAVLAASMLLYYGINIAALTLSGLGFNEYASNSIGSSGLLKRIYTAYRTFFGYFYRGHYDLVRPGISWVLHFVCIFIVGAELIVFIVREKRKGKCLLLILLLAVLPFGVNCINLIADSWHNLMTYGFVCVYVLAAVVTDDAAARLSKGGAARKLVSAAMALVLITNICYANSLYLKMYLQYEEASSFYTSLISSVEMTPGFDENSRLALVGRAENTLYTVDEIDTDDVVGVVEGLINIYSREYFLRYYSGTDLPLATESEVAALAESGVTEDMAEYPYSGSVRKIGDYIVVKLG